MSRRFDPLSPARVVRTLRWMCDQPTAPLSRVLPNQEIWNELPRPRALQAELIRHYGEELAQRFPDDPPDHHHYERVVLLRNGTRRIVRQTDFNHFSTYRTTRSYRTDYEDRIPEETNFLLVRRLPSSGRVAYPTLFDHQTHRFVPDTSRPKEPTVARGNEVFWIGPTRRRMLEEMDPDKRLSGIVRLEREFWWFVVKLRSPSLQSTPQLDPPSTVLSYEQRRAVRVMHEQQIESKQSAALRHYLHAIANADLGVDRRRVELIVRSEDSEPVLCDYLLQQWGCQPSDLEWILRTARWLGTAHSVHFCKTHQTTCSP